MESIIYEDSPLAEYLEGEGRGRASSPEASVPSSPTTTSFAPRGPSTLQSRIRDKLPQPLRIPIPKNGPIARIHTTCSRAVNSRLGRADNQRFIEHFRYLIVASQLLSEHTGQSSFRTVAIPNFGPDKQSQAPNFKVGSISLTGAVVTGATAFLLVWLLHWSRSRSSGFSKGRLLLVFLVFAVVATICYAYMRRHWLQYLRQQAVDGASNLITNLQAFDASTASALALIQEVELVSRGYRLSSPLPPITRLEEKGQTRRCHRLRKSLKSAFAATIPLLAEQCATLRQLVEEDDLEKYLDVYDINNPDLQEAQLGYSELEFEDTETLKALRTYQYRLATLRRLLLCSLLALEADGGKNDFARWRVAIQAIEQVTIPTGEWSDKINHTLGEEEQFVVPSPLKIQSNPGREKLRASVRKLSGLSQGIRGLQAKMQILREESNKSLEESEDISELGASLMAQYESIGADLKSLVSAWETGKASLALNIDRHERRVSQASSGGMRSPVPSLGGLTVVEEGTPSDALRALNGASPAHSSAPSVSGSNSDDEIFEAIAIPRTRKTLSREERMVKIHEDRARQVSLREQREASNNMMKELESVINLRPQRTNYSGRITSI
ncbi:uncharacterized protein BDZ99DRAFT_393810 [Mytilinidion resinicola]|uniref:Vezatin n=1 Tax=Mytilinidion resinicola TaxID=574789 RepID=A0A6A6YFX7_9PEZI|nr:uncharacterized protein BDZ99DRAFT_393810 [Mytilinidion resinicola]KAF2806924.1 hypothetical protein BDZ99DRAFT_393810 [Mytilinidion resinicola]